MQPAHVSHILLLFFFSFVLASAALVQHGVKLPLSNKVKGSENIELLLYHAFCGEKFFLWRRFLLVIEFKFHHTMLVLNAFLAISEGFVSDIQGSRPPPHPRRDLPLQPHLVCLLVRPHHPVKKNTWLRAWLLIYWAVRLNFFTFWIASPKLKSYFFRDHNYGLADIFLKSFCQRMAFL